MTIWAASALLGAEADRIFSSVEQGLTVGLIATFDGLTCCGADDSVSDVVARADLQAYDYVPVLQKGDIVGLLEGANSELPKDGPVRGAMQPLRGNMLISAEAGILSFVESAESIPCRLVLRSGRVDGIVTLSDLQKLPVRPALFLLITHVELLMAQWIRAQGIHEADLLAKLSSKRRDRVRGKWHRLQEDNLATDILPAMDFFDKRRLLFELGFPARMDGDEAEDLKRIENLRHAVAHAGDYALDREKALSTVAAVVAARGWIQRLERALNPD
ncbi:MAG: hypothetical protein M3R38_13380 [Actinomycetota bacterium]|nr:hypothetical protein [Actinomycetota bacterium]